MNKKPNWNPAIFRKNDIRGLYPKDFDLDFVQALALAFVAFFQNTDSLEEDQLKPSKGLPAISSERDHKPVVALGYDARLSSPEIAECLIKSLKQAGADVCFLGLVPSPVCCSASYFFKEITASIMITASHNPPLFNGFKMVVRKKTVCDKHILELQNLLQKGTVVSPKKSGIERSFDVESAYISFMQKRFLPVLEQYRADSPIRLVVDCGHGVSGPLAQKVLKSLSKKREHVKGAKASHVDLKTKRGIDDSFPFLLQWLYAQPDGHFPKHLPDPSIEAHLKDLKEAIKKTQSHFGVAFDGDGDRLVVVEKSGHVLQGDELMSIFISDMINQCPPQTKIVVDVKCGDWFFDFLKKAHLKVIMWPSGHSLIRQKTIEEKALFGGELSGHFFFYEEGYPIDDGLYSLLRLLEICLKKGPKLGTLKVRKDTWETAEIRYPIDPTLSPPPERLKSLKAFYKNQRGACCVFIDGVRVSFPGLAWGLARLSNTQGEWTFRFGGKNQEELQKIQADFYRLLHIKPPRLI